MLFLHFFFPFKVPIQLELQLGTAKQAHKKSALENRKRKKK